MGDGHLDYVRRTFEEWSKGHLNAGIERFHPEIHFESFMPDARDRTVRRGVEGVAGFMREFLGSWHDFRMVGESFRAVDDSTVLVEGFQTALGRTSGVAVRDSIASVWTFDSGGLVVRLIFERDRAVAARAAGGAG